MSLQFMLERFHEVGQSDAIVWRDRAYSYGWLSSAIERWRAQLAQWRVPAGAVVSVEADFSPESVAILLALIDEGCTVVPLTDTVGSHLDEFQDTAEVEVSIRLDLDGSSEHHITGRHAAHPLFGELRNNGHPGLILFSSGSTGKHKASIHDFSPLLEKFKVRRHALRTITFLLFDHIGGVNTLFYALSNGGCIITVDDRSPDAVCHAIAKHQAQLLPTSPTFLNLLLLSEAYKRHDLSSLELVTYGTEVMPESTLRRVVTALPHVRLLQTYGLSEVGILRSKSRSSDSLWVRVGGEGYQTRVVDGLLEIKAASAMLGYLNHESPFTEDGWFKTGDAVEVDGEYIKILGRQSDLINVGGEKVYPAEVESVLQQMDGVEDVAVTGVPNPITGHSVSARVKLSSGESPKDFRRRLHAFCRDKLARYKIPQKIEIVAEGMHGARFKKMR